MLALVELWTNTAQANVERRYKVNILLQCVNKLIQNLSDVAHLHSSADHHDHACAGNILIQRWHHDHTRHDLHQKV